MLSDIQQRALDEKVKQLRWVKGRVCTSKELAELITRRRARWLEENLD